MKLLASLFVGVVAALPGSGGGWGGGYGGGSGNSSGGSSNSSQSSTQSSICNDYMCVSGSLNGSTATYSLSSTGSATPGWMAIGFGTQMRGSDMVILWSNSDGSITLSQRTASGQVEPTVVDSPASVATLSNDLSSTSGDATFTFTMDAPDDTSQSIIYALSTTNPGDSSTDASIVEHIAYGVATLDLTGGDNSSTGSSTQPLQPFQRILAAHAILCIVGFLFFLPAGAISARYLRTFSTKWFTGHWILQFALGGPIIIAGIALGYRGMDEIGGTHLDNAHKRWGIAIFVLYFAQCALGGLIHFVKPSRSSRRPPQNYLHAVIGILIVALALYQVRDGFDNEWPRITGRELGRGPEIVWYVWVVLLPVVYFAGMAFLPKQYRQESDVRAQFAKQQRA